MRKRPGDLFFYQPVFSEGLETGLLLLFKIWPLKNVIVANTLVPGSLVLNPDHCTERTPVHGTRTRVQSGTAFMLHKGPVLVSKQTTTPKNPNLTKTSPLSMPPTFPQLFTVLFRFSMWSLIQCPIFLFIKKNLMNRKTVHSNKWQVMPRGCSYSFSINIMASFCIFSLTVNKTFTLWSQTW